MNHLLSAPLQQFYQQWRAVINDSHPEVDGIWTGLRLVGGIPTHLKNMTSSVGMMTFPIYGKIKARFQTTNQEKKLSNMGICLICPYSIYFYLLQDDYTYTAKNYDQSCNFAGLALKSLCNLFYHGCGQIYRYHGSVIPIYPHGSFCWEVYPTNFGVFGTIISQASWPASAVSHPKLTWTIFPLSG